MDKRPALSIAIAAALFAAHPAAGQGQAAEPRGPGPAVKEAGRLGGGYRDAKWGMSMAEVKKRLAGRLEYETRLPNIEKILRLDIGEGRKVTCNFDHDQFYQAIYKPVAADGDQVSAEAASNGLERKYGPGKAETGYSDKDGKALKIVTWNDGTSRIEFRMRDPKAPASASERESWVYPSSTVVVIYTDITATMRREQRQEEERKRLDEKRRRQKIQDIQQDL
ncbi:MAG: hypothetical protein PHU21_07190 [Elusimicrobia bacterium]|nr:hypothetical protein [Elusimicrobiota bacterium]